MTLSNVAPMKSIQLRKHHRNWLDNEVKLLMKQRDSLRESARRSTSQQDWDNYKNFKKKVLKNAEKRKKTEYMNKMFDTFNENNYSKSLYSTAKDLMGWTSSGCPTSLIWEGNIVRKPVEIANYLQNYFNNKNSEINVQFEEKWPRSMWISRKSNVQVEWAGKSPCVWNKGNFCQGNPNPNLSNGKLNSKCKGIPGSPH